MKRDREKNIKMHETKAERGRRETDELREEYGEEWEESETLHDMIFESDCLPSRKIFRYRR